MRIDTSDPPGNEKPAAEYLKQVLEAEGIPVQVFALEPNRPNVVARLKGSGTQAAAPDHGPHRRRQRRSRRSGRIRRSAPTRDGGYVYGRGTVDDKDNVVAGADDDADC